MIVCKPPSIAISRDADQSLVSVDVRRKFLFQKVSSEQSDTDANPVFYEMKTLSRKGKNRSPSVSVSFHSASFNRIKEFLFCFIHKKKVEFREINRAMPRSSVMVHPRSKARDNSNHHCCHCCHCCAETIVNIPSQQGAESQQFRQPRSFCSTIRKLLPCLRLSRNQQNKGDEENIEHLSDEEDNAEFYYFDHGSTSFYRTTDCPPQLIADKIAQRTTDIATKFWAEFFGSLNIGVAFIITFILQFYR